MVKICATDISFFNKHICFQIWLKNYVQQMGNEPTHCFLYISPAETNSAKRCEMCEKKSASEERRVRLEICFLQHL